MIISEPGVYESGIINLPVGLSSGLPAGPRPMRLSGLLEGMACVGPAEDGDISGLALDSRSTHPGDLFMACVGTYGRGHDFIAQALSAGAAAVAYDSSVAVHVELTAAPSYQTGAPLIAVEDLGRQVGEIAGRFYGRPSHELCMVGITGTNGKTSCAHFLGQALSADHPCAVIGTLGYGLYGRPVGQSGARGGFELRRAATHTTPDAISVHGLLAELRRLSARAAVMEVSSHALAQDRVAGVAFDIALFTNLSRDHLDYHGDLESYAGAKRRLFQSPGLKYAVINTDDAYGRRFLGELPAQIRGLGYGLNASGDARRPDVWASALELRSHGLKMQVHSPWGTGVLESPLIGAFNARNLLAVLGALLLMDVPLSEALYRLGRLRTVSGRTEVFRAGPDRPLAVVDYAHTPDALEQVLSALRAHCGHGRLWCVFGCGGDRDQGKRPLMGEVAERLADRVIVTDDNPRHEDGGVIVKAILAGMRDPSTARVERDRARAIALAVGEAGAGDVVLIAGKGHEDYQQIGDHKYPFSDRLQVEMLGFHADGGSP